MLRMLKRIFSVQETRRQKRAERAEIEAWSLHFGREGAELWVEALSVRDAARLSNA